MLNVVCVRWGEVFHRDYVKILAAGVRRNIRIPHRFICFTDDPRGCGPGVELRFLPDNLIGWWPKIWLHKPGHFKDGDRILFLDLDTIVCGDITKIASYRGPFAILRDFYRPDGYGSGLMAWPANKTAPVWDLYQSSGRPELEGGDQAWMEMMVPNADRWQDLFPGQILSYKVHCREGLPEDARIVCFHGFPRPHQAEGWVKDRWRVG